MNVSNLRDSSNSTSNENTNNINISNNENNDGETRGLDTTPSDGEQGKYLFW